MRPLLLLVALALILSQCRPIEVKVDGEVEVEDATITASTTQLENFLCITGELQFCYCPSPDPSVQAQCNEFDLPERLLPPTCDDI